MIFYFTGTGNSLYVAKQIADYQGEKVISIAKEMRKKNENRSYKVKESDIIGFVFPIYAWAPPKMVLDFIKSIKIEGNPYVFSISTCGEEEGKSTNLIRKVLSEKNLNLDAAFSIMMPNNYIIGFDIDKSEQVDKKLTDAEAKIIEINQIIRDRKQNIKMIKEGRLPKIKTKLVNPIFQRYALNTKSFYAEDNCTRCGMCESVCPVKTIKVYDKPVWGNECTQCLACINRCPSKAIQHGKNTKTKGRYQHPELVIIENHLQKIKEL